MASPRLRKLNKLLKRRRDAAAQPVPEEVVVEEVKTEEVVTEETKPKKTIKKKKNLWTKKD
tara:strand:+ start:1005 stop:1187 length:183 start_codon:yes stop_codon:yes gene_type:complete